MRRGLLQLKRPLCLASASPQRRDLLAQFGWSFQTAAADLAETPHPEEDAETLVRRLAREKAEAVRHLYPQHGIIAADTLVLADGKLLGKPRDAQHATEMLELLSGSRHQVLTGYALLDAASGALAVRVVSTTVQLTTLPSPWIAAYIACGEGWGKAGSYAVQGLGAAMITSIEGSYSNVVGLPLDTLIWDLLERGWVSW